MLHTHTCTTVIVCLWLFPHLSNQTTDEDDDRKIPEPMFKQCKKPGDTSECPQGLTCMDYGDIYDTGKHTVICDCFVPTDQKECLCKSGDDNIYRRWTYMKANPGTPKFNQTWPKATFNRSGCYLNAGEICSVAMRESEKAEVYDLCKWDYYCQAITYNVDSGWCHYGQAPTTFLPYKFQTIVLASIVSYGLFN